MPQVARLLEVHEQAVLVGGVRPQAGQLVVRRRRGPVLVARAAGVWSVPVHWWPRGRRAGRPGSSAVSGPRSTTWWCRADATARPSGRRCRVAAAVAVERAGVEHGRRAVRLSAQAARTPTISVATMARTASAWTPACHRNDRNGKLAGKRLVAACQATGAAMPAAQLSSRSTCSSVRPSDGLVSPAGWGRAAVGPGVTLLVHVVVDPRRRPVGGIRVDRVQLPVRRAEHRAALEGQGPAGPRRAARAGRADARWPFLPPGGPNKLEPFG